MSVVSRLGEIVRQLAHTGLEVVAIFTETLKLAAEHLDGFVDDLKDKV